MRSKRKRVEIAPRDKKKTLRMPRGPTRWVDPFFEWLPVVGVVMLLSWTYYVYMSVLCGSLIEDLAWRALTGGRLSRVVLALPLVLHLHHSGRLSENERERLDATKGFDERRQYLEELGNRRGVLTLGIDGCVRYCAICQRIKPDRCHHCSWCRRCVPKMDHHCPWFNNCVSFTSQKSFLLTTAYACLLAAFSAITSVVHAVYSWFNPGFSFATINVSALVVGGTYLSLGIGSFFYLHLDNTFRNVTTLEKMRATVFREAGDSFDLGRQKNLQQASVFGQLKPLWLLPLFTSLGDGTRFPTKLHPDPDRLQLPLVLATKDGLAGTPGGATARPTLLPAVLPATMASGNGFAVARPPAPLRGPSLVGHRQVIPEHADYPRMPLLLAPHTGSAAQRPAHPSAAPR
ncbi:hypothetical protein MRX96_015520 [Rhipicephalus microplus]